MFQRRTYRLPSIPLALLLLAGCGGPSPPADPYPPPGSMTVLSVAPAPAHKNLIPNGDFQEWYAGLSFPTGFDAPAAPGISTVDRDRMYGHLGTAGYTARQTWRAFDASIPPGERFGASINLNPEQDYELAVVASAAPDMAANVAVYVAKEDGTTAMLAGSLVDVSGEEPQRYTTTFRTGQHGAVMVRAQVSPLAKLPGAVTWSSWSVTPLAGAGEPPPRNAWIANTLDHVREQVAVYGGLASWSTALTEIYSNFRRVRREADDMEGNAILGYDRYIFQEVDLSYVCNVRSFVSEAGESTPNRRPRPAFRALVALDRALAAQGIDLVVVPLPDRIHLFPDRIHKPAADLPPSYLPHTQFIQALSGQGVVAVDLATRLMHRRSEGQPVYWHTNYGVPSYTLREIAVHIAPMIAETVSRPPEPDVTLTLKTQEQNLAQRAVPGLPPHMQKLIEPEQRTIYMIRDENDRPFEPAAKSPVLVAGMLATAHDEFGASLAAHLSHELGYRVSVIDTPLEDQEVPRHLIEDATALESVEVVVFCMPEYALVRPGW